jgi:hypothetical protein
MKNIGDCRLPIADFEETLQDPNLFKLAIGNWQFT